MILHPSLASADPLRYGEALAALEHTAIGSVHLDIEDTSFISNVTFGLKTVNAVARHTAHPLSFHLMVSRPDVWLSALAALRPAWIFVHAEALDNPSEVLTAIRATGARAGLAFNPATDPGSYRYLAPRLDALLIMTSEPDGEQQQFIPAMMEKVRQARAAFPDAQCWADGGINHAAARLAARAGAQHLVIGRALFSSPDYPTTLAQLASPDQE